MRTATTPLVLLPSPFLGPAVWEPVAGELSERGRTATPASAAVPAPRTPQDVLDGFLDAVPDDRDVVLVPHSNASLYVPALVDRRRVAGVVLVDAALPPRQGRAPLAPPQLYDLLTELADDDGVLPPWTEWWDKADVAALFPSDEVWEHVEREQPRLPLSYCSATLPVQEGWYDGLPAAHLSFGDTYAEERDRATRWGWPTSRLPGRHLHMLVDPPQVADEIETLLSRLGVPPSA